MILPTTAPGSVECIIEFPKLDAPEQQAAALKLVQKPEPEADGRRQDEDETDEKEWLN